MPKMNIEQWSEKLFEATFNAAAHFKNEMELREALHPIIADAILDLYGLGIASSSAEHATPSLGKGNKKFYDRLYGGVVVEWEWSMGGARREHGAKQGLEYLELLRASNSSVDPYTAVVADGLVWGFLQFDPQAELDLSVVIPETATLHYSWYKNSPAACQQFLELIGSHQQSPITASSLKQRFGPDSELSGRMVTVFSQSMAGRLEMDRTDTLYKEWRRALDVVYGDLDERDGALAQVVKDYYKVPVLRSVGEYLFVLHTYFALVSRLIAVELLAIACQDQGGRPSGWRALNDADLVRKLIDLENGALPGGLELDNLFEADLFSWWAVQAEGNTDMLSIIREALKQLGELAFPQIAFGPAPAGDVLRDLYQSLVPSPLRKALGEFLTPQWLASACIERVASIEPSVMTDGRVLDPTCGTGSFLLPILSARLRRLKAVGSATVDQVQQVLDSVCGIDLNPVAVTATRVNYAIALGELAGLGHLTLPVWRADSLLVPDLPSSQGVMGPLAGYTYGSLETSLSDPFPIPISLGSANQVAVLRELIEGEILKPKESPHSTDELLAAADSFADSFGREFGPTGRAPLDCASVDGGFNNEAAVAKELFRQVQELSEDGRDGIWARLIENAFAPIFAGRFDIVIGNPPWVTWTRLPESWRNRSQSIWKRYGLWYTPAEVGESFSLATNDMATLVFAVALDRYSASNGVVALLTPDALLRADPGGRAFRQFHLTPAKRDKPHFDTDVHFGLEYIDDWQAVTPFAPDAANKPVFIVARRDKKFSAPVPGTSWKKIKGTRHDKSSWRDSRQTLEAASGTFSPVSPTVTFSSLSFQDSSKPQLIKGGENSWTFGTGLHTRGANGIFFVTLEGKLTPSNTLKVKNDPANGRNSDVQTIIGTVESSLVFPLLRGRDVEPWAAKPKGYVIVPHDPADLDKPIGVGEMKSKYPNAFKWLGRSKSVLSKRHAPPQRNWNMSATGADWYRMDGAFKYMQAPHLVVVREFESRPAAAVVESAMYWDLGRSATPMIDHKLMLCAVGSSEEALYLVAQINSTPMQDLLESFVSSISVSPKSLKRLPIPDFDPADPTMTAIATKAKARMEAQWDPPQAAALSAELDTLIVQLLALKAYQPQPKISKAAVKTQEVDPQDVLF